MEEETKRSGDHKVFLILPKPTKPKSGRRCQEESDEDEDEEEEEIMMSLDTHYVLWLPAFWEEELSRMRGHFNGDQESNTIKQRLQKGNTDTGNLTMNILSSEYEHIKSYRSIPKKFVGALALVYAATEDPHWMMDNEFPEEISKIWKTISSYFRNTLLKKTDQELGLGLPNDSVDSEGFSDSRKALYILLAFRAAAFNDIEDYGGKVEFKWKPNKSRKRKTTTDRQTLQSQIPKQPIIRQCSSSPIVVTKDAQPLRRTPLFQPNQDHTPTWGLLLTEATSDNPHNPNGSGAPGICDIIERFGSQPDEATIRSGLPSSVLFPGMQFYNVTFDGPTYGLALACFSGRVVVQKTPSDNIDVSVGSVIAAVNSHIVPHKTNSFGSVMNMLKYAINHSPVVITFAQDAHFERFWVEVLRPSLAEIKEKLQKRNKPKT